MEKFMAIFFAVFLAIASTGRAEELAPGFDACVDNAVNTAENVECLNNAYEYWDKRLNANFKQAKARCADAENAKTCADNLIMAQKLWIQYKETMVKVLYDLGGGGTMDQLTVGSFLADETKKQAKLLEGAE